MNGLAIFNVIVAAAFGWCLSEAYLAGPDKHRREGAAAVQAEAVMRGHARMLELPDGRREFVWLTDLEKAAGK